MKDRCQARTKARQAPERVPANGIFHVREHALEHPGRDDREHGDDDDERFDDRDPMCGGSARGVPPRTAGNSHGPWGCPAS